MSDQSLVLALDALKQVLTDIAEFRESVEMRLDRLDDISRKHRRDSAGTLVMMRATAGDFDARVSEIEERVAALEGERRI